MYKTLYKIFFPALKKLTIRNKENKTFIMNLCYLEKSSTEKDRISTWYFTYCG